MAFSVPDGLIPKHHIKMSGRAGDALARRMKIAIDLCYLKEFPKIHVENEYYELLGRHAVARQLMLDLELGRHKDSVRKYSPACSIKQNLLEPLITEIEGLRWKPDIHQLSYLHGMQKAYQYVIGTVDIGE